MKKVNLILVAIIVMSVSVFSQTKDTLSILAIKGTAGVYDNFNFHKLKSKTDKNFFEKLNLKETEQYFNSILQNFNLRINSVSGGGIMNVDLSENIGFIIKYGTLKLDKNFSKLRVGTGKRLHGKVLGVDLGISLKEKNNFRLFLSVGNNWIKIDNGNKISSFRASIGIKIK